MWFGGLMECGEDVTGMVEIRSLSTCTLYTCGVFFCRLKRLNLVPVWPRRQSRGEAYEECDDNQS